MSTRAILIGAGVLGALFYLGHRGALSARVTPDPTRPALSLWVNTTNVDPNH